jgi:hypothetical protein
MPKDLGDIFNEQEQLVQDLYGQTLSQKSRRFIKFIEATPSSFVIKTTLLPTSLGLTLGGTVGGIIGLIGGPKGAAVGASSGVGIGLLAGSSYASHHTRKAYKHWLKQYRNDEILAEMLEIFKRYPALNEFKCSLSGEIMHFPHADPWGHVFEKQAIENWIKKHGTSPVTKLPLKIAELRPDYLTMGKLAKYYHEILEEESSQTQMNSIQKQCVSSLLKDLKEQEKACFYAENKLLLEGLKTGKISRKVYASQLTILANILDR